MTNSRKTVAFVLALAFAAAHRECLTAEEPSAAARNIPVVTLPLMKTPPQIDGVIDEQEWAGAARSIGFIGHETRVATPRAGVLWVGCDGQQLYIAMKTEMHPDGKLLAATEPDGKRDLIGAFNDDSIELVLDPKRGRKQGDRTYYHLITNPNGALYDLALNPDNPQNPVDFTWRIEGWTYKNQVKDGWWHIEVAIPLATMGATKDDLKGPWGIRIARNWRRPGEQSQWETGAIDYNDQATMAVAHWDEAAPVVQNLSLGDGKDKADIVVSIWNPHKTPVSVSAYIADAWHSNQPSELKRDIQIAPGQRETLTLASPDGGPAGLHHTTIRVTSADGAKVYYFRDWRWPLHRPAGVWQMGGEKEKTVELKFKYYPYESKIRFALDLGKVGYKDQVTGGTAEIKKLDRMGSLVDRVVWSTQLKFAKFVSEGVYDVPDLGDGTYQVSVRLAGGEGVPKDAFIQRFVRVHYDWEHNKLGVSDEVMPPFTPMAAEGSVVKCVLREHEHGPEGLWKAARSQGRELLTAPMRWEVVAAAPGGQPAQQEVKGEGWKCLAAKPTGVTGEAAWSAGPVKARVLTEYDYDGMMLVTLTLEPTGQASVHRLSLVIPIKDSEARYMHAVGDGLRHNYAGFTPKGEGKVWDSNKANKIDIVGTFFPYLWVGGGERGVCWFADTDRDCLLDEATPEIELTRAGETLEMRVNLITKPGALERQHKIVFGLQATPTKPMPDGWRRWVGRKVIPGGRAVSWMGACYYWGAPSFGVYPLDKRFEIYTAFAQMRRTGEWDLAFVDKWMKYVEQLYPKDSQEYAFTLAHIRAGSWSAKGSPWNTDIRLFGYTNARGISFCEQEFETFQDEWLRYDWFNRDWKGGDVAYDVSPSDSFVDFAVWYYRRMLECMEGVYWDNVYLSAHYDPVMGSAWTDEKGRTHPGMGLFHLRELVKRTAVMHWQESKGLPASRLPLIQLSHMTNTMIVPVLSFGNSNMDWEWRYGDTDFQDRFSPDLTVAETIGRQVGAWGTILGGGHPDPKDPRTAWVWRTRLGIGLVHEIQNFDYEPALDSEIYKKLFEFGYGAPDCRVFNYWDLPHPVSVKSEGVDGKTIAIARGGKAVIVVTDYGNGGDCTVKLDLAALGLGAEAKAADFETGQAIEKVGPGEFKFQLKKHDFKIFRAE